MMCDPVTLDAPGKSSPFPGPLRTYKSAPGVILSGGLAVIEAVA